MRICLRCFKWDFLTVTHRILWFSVNFSSSSKISRAWNWNLSLKYLKFFLCSITTLQNNSWKTTRWNLNKQRSWRERKRGSDKTHLPVHPTKSYPSPEGILIRNTFLQFPVGNRGTENSSRGQLSNFRSELHIKGVCLWL